MSTSRTDPAYSPRRIDQQPRLVRPERHRQIGPQRRAPHLTGVRVDAARQVDGDDGGPGARGGLGERYGLGPQPALPPDADDPVDDEVGPLDQRFPRTGVRDGASGPPQRRESPGVRPPGRQRHGGDTRAAPREPRPGVQGVAPVVAAAHQQHDPAAVHPSQHLCAGGGESGRRPLHQRPLRQPGHQLPLRRPDRFHAVRGPHPSTSPAPRRPLRSRRTH
ncbi:hypothetical protein RKD49_004752 [Streptomyces glaucescens]